MFTATLYTTPHECLNADTRTMTPRQRYQMAHSTVRFYRRRSEEGTPVSLQTKHLNNLAYGDALMNAVRFQIYNRMSVRFAPVTSHELVLATLRRADDNGLGFDWAKNATSDIARAMYLSPGFNALKYRDDVYAQFGVTFDASATESEIDAFAAFETYRDF